MYLNRQDIKLLTMSDRNNQASEVNAIFNNHLDNVIQTRQLSPTITEPFPEPISVIRGKDLILLLSLPMLFLIMGFILKNTYQKISNSYSECQTGRLFALSKKKLNFVKNNSKIACRHCQFFNKNHYLKCAVHPDRVLTKEAKNCLDYQKKRHKK